MRPYSLSISNIAWQNSEDLSVYSLMGKYGFSGLEIAPTKIWPDPYGQSDNTIKEFKDSLSTKGLRVVSFQSLLFGHPEMTIFSDNGSRESTLDHLKKNVLLAEKLGSPALVFGSPKNRIIGETDPTAVKRIAHNFFEAIGSFASEHRTCICMEANPTVYGGDFICTTNEALDFVKLFNNPGIRINIDLGTIISNNEDAERIIKEAIPYAGHFHISEPYLEKIVPNKDYHKKISQILNECGYDKSVSIEMKCSPDKNTRDRLVDIEETLAFVSSTY